MQTRKDNTYLLRFWVVAQPVSTPHRAGDKSVSNSVRENKATNNPSISNPNGKQLVMLYYQQYTNQHEWCCPLPPDTIGYLQNFAQQYFTQHQQSSYCFILFGCWQEWVRDTSSRGYTNMRYNKKQRCCPSPLNMIFFLLCRRSLQELNYTANSHTAAQFLLLFHTVLLVVKSRTSMHQ